MLVTPVNEWGLVIDSNSGVRPSGNYGALVTPGNNTYGSYVSLLAGASVTDDAYGLWLNVNSIGTSATATDTLVTLGVDPAGGTSFTDTIVDLIASMAVTYSLNSGAGVAYYFPLFIKAGSSIGLKATQNNASPTNARAFVRLYCRPSRPELVRAGSKVVTYGSTPATSTGTAVTPGTTAEGAWTQLGSAIASGDQPWFWQLGLGVNNSAATSQAIHIDLGIGDATNKRTPILDVPVNVLSTEVLTAVYPGAFANGAPGDLVYGRAQGGSVVMTGTSMIAYGVI